MPTKFDLMLNIKKIELIVLRHKSKLLEFLPFMKHSGLHIYLSQSVKYLGVHRHEQQPLTRLGNHWA